MTHIFATHPFIIGHSPASSMASYLLFYLIIYLPDVRVYMPHIYTMVLSFLTFFHPSSLLVDLWGCIGLDQV